MKKRKRWRITRTLAKRVEDFFIPPLCVVCDKSLDDGGYWFCVNCLDTLTTNHTTRDACPRCAQNRRKHDCACEFSWDFPFERVFSFYDYDDTMSSIARHIKYKGKSRLAHYMGFISAPLVPRDFWDGVDLVVPVPLHRARRWKRGYNQAELFAQGLLKGEGTRSLSLRTDLLTRVRNTGTQTRLDREGRLENLVGAFTINPRYANDIKDKRVVLVDDILTTGATTEACTEELLRGGCESVRVLALGRD